MPALPGEAVRAEARAFAERFLAEGPHAGLFAHLRQALGLDVDAMVAGYLRYAFDSYDSDNSIYDDPAVRCAMQIEYLTPASYHARRQQLVQDALIRHAPASIADIGFGAPMCYLRDYVLAESGRHAVLFDKFESALQLGRAVVQYWGGDRSGAVRFAAHDMDAGAAVGAFDCYVLQDAIEHARDPAGYLRATLRAAPAHAVLLLQMPLGPLIESHFIAWPDACQALGWLHEFGLREVQVEYVEPNPAADFFARGENTLTSLFVAARRA
ncbi:MAG: hypothetical protein KF778_11710 [Rhodocyclaceae bacterium]|nr:hypothetical protein [Rhodocyclaceae bacterium]MBX3669062.1 hypothetical protein [Rhodocyclaceae bacterium]